MIDDKRLEEIWDQCFDTVNGLDYPALARAIESEALEFSAQIAEQNCLYDAYTIANEIRKFKVVS